jgi:hypothetical protein
MLLLAKILVDTNGVLDHNLEATRWIKVLSAVVLAKSDLYYFIRYFLDKSMFIFRNTYFDITIYKHIYLTRKCLNLFRIGLTVISSPSIFNYI